MTRPAQNFLRPYWYTTPAYNALFLVLALVPQVLMLAISQSYQALIVVGATLLAALAAEALNMLLTRTRIFHALLAAEQGLLVGLFLPETFPPWAAFLLTLCTLLIAYHSFGGVASAWVSGPALAVAMGYFIGAQFFPPLLLSRAQLVTENPSTLLLSQLPLIAKDPAITAVLNSLSFPISGTVLPQGFVTLFWDTGALIPAARFNLITLVTSVVLLATGVLRPLVPFCFTATYLVLVRVFAPVVVGGALGTGDMLLAALTGGTLVTAFFLLDGPGLAPLSRQGKIVYSCGAGALMFLFCGSGTSPAGAVFTVLGANLLSVFVQFAELQYRNSKFKHTMKPLIEEYIDAFE
jgi:electron transport complex protein RnfD